MSYIFGGLTLLLSSLSLLASGENIVCSGPNENCKLKLQTVNIFNPHRRGLYRPIYPINEVVNLSNHALTRLISERRNSPPFEVTTQYPILNPSAEIFISTTPHHGAKVPYVDLYGVTDLILSNNNVTVETLVTILYDQRIEANSQTHPLKYLDLSYLNISWLPDYIFGRFGNIKILKLNNNPIHDINNVASSIRHLRLQELDISGCGLRFLPDIFQDIPLIKLNLNNNFLTHVPRLESVENSLLKLSIDGNPLSVLDDTSFSTFHIIEEISVENCSIQAITGRTFSEHFRLIKLNLNNNKIRYLLPDDISLEHTVVSLENNLWDCTCKNLWLMRETQTPFSNLVNPYNMRCVTPALYTNRSLYEVASIVEELGNCDSFFLNFLRRPPPVRPLPPLPHSHLFGGFMSKTVMASLLVIAGLLTIIAAVATVVLMKKFRYNSRQQIYKPLYDILQHKDPEYLHNKIDQHI